METTVIVHYHEIGLRGKNRRYFEKALQDNLDRALADIPHGAPERLQGRLEIPLKEGACRETINERLARVPGVVFFSFAVRTTTDLEDMGRAAWQLICREPFESFRIRSKRADKSYPMTSTEIDAAVGAYILERRPARVNLTHPDLTCHIELLHDQSFVYTSKFPGTGGLPVSPRDRIVCLLSGGIDSPVAAYRLMRRGAHITFVHFHGAPFTDRSSQDVARQLAQELSRYQLRSALYLVPFGEIQREISLQCGPAYRILLYRRMMLRIAEVVAAKEEALALGTGESLGQVASQTLSNLRTIDAAATLPVLRPLIGDDKRDIVKAAEAIGTYAISTTPHVEDCCPLFMPAQPVTHSNLEDVVKAEASLQVDALVAQGIAAMKVEHLLAPWLEDV